MGMNEVNANLAVWDEAVRHLDGEQQRSAALFLVGWCAAKMPEADWAEAVEVAVKVAVIPDRGYPGR